MIHLNKKHNKHLIIWSLFILLSIIKINLFCDIYLFGWGNIIHINALYLIAFYIQYLFICPLYKTKLLYFSLTIVNTITFLYLHVLSHSFIPYEACDVNGISQEEYQYFMSNNIFELKYLARHIEMSILITVTAIATHILENKYAQENKMQTLENMYLKSQLSPHFLLNSLNNIYSLAVQKSDKILINIENLSELLKYSLYKIELKEIPLIDEIEHIKLYLKSINQKREDGFNISITQSKLPSPIIKIKPLILFNFIENSIKHSGIESNENAWIHLDINYEQDQLIFKLENSKCDNINKEKNEFRGIGLKNTQQRLATFYKKNHTLTIKDLKHTFTIVLILNLKK